jgi:proline iminopeptidase
VKLILVVAAIGILGLGGLGIFWFLSLGKPGYRPGGLLAEAGSGRLSLEPVGKLQFKEASPGVPGAETEGTQSFRLEVEKGIFLEGFARGRGKPVLVVHGGPGYASDQPWPGLEGFENRYRFYYWHQRGSGRSTRPIDRFATMDFPKNVARLEGSLGLGQQIADMERLRRAIGVDRIDIIGHSFGGFMACLAAIEFPSSIDRLFLVAPAPLILFPAASGGLYEEIRRALPAEDKPAYEAWLKDFFDYGKLFSRSEAELQKLNAGMIPFYAKAMGATGDAAEVSRQANPDLIGGWMMQAIFFSMGRRHDWSAAFAGITAPATLVFGTRDLTEAGSFDQYRSIPGLTMRSVGESDHFLMDDREKFAGIAQAFFF